MKRCLLAIILFGSTLVLHAQNGYWEEANGPYGGQGALISAANGKLVYNSYDWIYAFVSSNGGLNWNRVPNNLIDSNATGNYSIKAGNGGNFFKTLEYSDGVKRVFRSTDDGVSWHDAFSADSIHRFVETINGTLIGTNSSHLLRSTNGGQSWGVVFESNSGNYIENLSIGNNGNIWAYYGADSILRSQNNGQTWAKLYVPVTGSSIHVTNNGTILISSIPGIYRSSNNGLTYQSFDIDTSFSSQRGTFCTLSSGRILFTLITPFGSKKIFYSDNNGLTWFPLGAPPKLIILHNVRLSDGTIFCNRVGGLYRSSDGGNTWQFSSKGIHAHHAKLLFASADTIYAGRVGSLQRTFDGGENWEKISNDTCERGNLYALYDRKKLVFMLDEHLFLSPDEGNTHIDITPPVQINGSNFNYQDFNAAVKPLSKTFIASNPLKSFRSIDEGQTWIEIPDLKYLRDIQFHKDGTIYAIRHDTYGLLKSIDDGITWEIIDLDTIQNLCVSKTGSVFVANPEGFFKWDPIAIDWVKKSLPLNFEPYTQASLISNEQGFLFCYDRSHSLISMSINEAETWQTIPLLSSFFNFEYSPPPFSTYQEIGHDQHLYFTTPAGMFRSSKSTLEGAFLRGNVYRDEDDDCLTYETTTPLKNWVVKAINEIETYTTTNQQGEYVMLLDTGIYNVSVSPINGIWWSMCDTFQTTTLELFGESDTLNFSALPLSDCPLMSVNIATPQLRRCFNNQVYVEYCNQGTETADSAWVDVILDPYLSFVGSSQANEVLGNNTIRFFVGDIQSGECGQFQLTVYVNCDSTTLGQTHCISAHGFPDTLCTIVPNWSGANITASVTCQDTTLQFSLENNGSAASQSLEYIIIEDDVVLLSGQNSYGIGETTTFEQPANGSTWRIESAQEPGHPFSNLALAFAEGCGGFGSLGYINQFPVNGIQPSWHRMCVENIGAFDPNDKQGFPIGVGSEHNIRPGQAIDYLIRFQNTGTDTAFTVVIRDTLSTFLDPISIRAGASSHAYTWSLSGQGVIHFTFNNIMLPDSNVNEPLSHGFVQFNIAPYADVPLGSVVENNAAIYFDFNTPVITNTTWHTIQKSPLSSIFEPKPNPVKLGLEVWPNPFNERTNIRLEKKNSGTVMLKIYDSRGTLVVQQTAIGPDIEFNAKHLPTGMYWAEVRDMQGRLLGNGKLVKE